MKAKTYQLAGTAVLIMLASTNLPAQKVDAVAASEPTIIERGPHHRVWEYAVDVPVGKRTLKQIHRYTELASGMHYLDSAGQWQEAHEQIDIVNGFGVATQGQVQVIFSPNLNTAGAIDVVTPDGRFQSTILGLAFTDISGKSVLIAEVTNATGQVVGNNQVIYPGALVGDGWICDARYTYRRGSFEQEILLRSQLPSPAEYGLDPSSTRLEVWTEFFEAATPQVARRLLKPDSGAPVAGAVDQYFADDTLDFGTMRIGPGTAFSLGEAAGDPFEEPPAVVGKTWTTINDRQFLIEKVVLSDVAAQLARLPKTAGVNQPNNGKGAGQTAQLAGAAGTPGKVSRALLRPRKELLLSLSESRARSSAFRRSKNRASNKSEAGASAQSLLASQGKSPIKNVPGVSIDYTLMVNQTNWVFQGDSTYLINGALNLAGTTILEGGAVLKFTNGTGGARITLQGPLDCRTSQYRPAIFTGKNDDSVGEKITGSSGNPATNYFGNYLSLSGNTNCVDLHDVHFRHAYYAIQDQTGAGLTNRHCQFTSNYAAFVWNSSQGTWLRNVLICQGVYGFGGGNSSDYHCEHLTAHKIDSFHSSAVSTNMGLTNCLLISVTNYVTYTGVNVISNLDDTGIFQTVGWGSHYLCDNSTNRNAGTTNINPALATALKSKTTYPPILMTNAITMDVVLFPQAQRDTDAPDIGYEYDPLDYLISGVTVASNVTVLATNGVAIAVDYSQLSAGAGWGFILQSARFISQGSALALNEVTRVHAVQEGGAGNPSTRAIFYDNAADFLTLPSQLSETRFRFTELTQMSSDGYLFYSGTASSDLEFTHSRVYNPSIVVDTSGSAALTCGLTNTLWERGGVEFGVDTSGSAVLVHMRNNLPRTGSWHFVAGSTNWTVRDNLFDSLSALDNHGSTVQNSYNAFFNTGTTNFSGGTSSTNLTNLVYNVGALGNYYQPTNSLLINAGSRNATNAGLYHFCTTTNQVKETNSVVDIGLHFVAVDASTGQPGDFDGDGIPDYFEDFNGNGSVESGESDWKIYTSKNKLTGASGLQVFTPLK